MKLLTKYEAMCIHDLLNDYIRSMPEDWDDRYRVQGWARVLLKVKP